MIRVSDRDRRTGVIGGLACLFIVVATRGLPWLAEVYSAQRANAAELRARLTRQIATVAALPASRAELALTRGQLDTLATQLFVAVRANAAAAEVVRLFAAIAEDSRVELGAIDISIDTTGVSSARVMISASARADVHGFTHMLSVLEGGSKTFRVTAFAVSNGSIARDVDAPEALEVRLTVQTLALVGAGAERIHSVFRATRSNQDVFNAARFIASHNPFRSDRRPAAVAFGAPPTPPPVVATRPQSAARPVFVLRGIVGGPPWRALVDGLPGRNGSVLVEPGDHIAQFVISDITRDRVIIIGPDTTWTLPAVPLWR